MLSRKLSLYSNIYKSNRLLTITDSHFLGSHKGPGIFPTHISASSQLSHSRWVPGPKSIFFRLKGYNSTYTYQPFFFLFTSQYSIFSYLNYHKKGWLLPKEKIIMILKDHIKVNLIQPIEPHTKRNPTGNGERIFKKLGNWFLIQIKDFSILHNIFKFKTAEHKN